MKIFGRRRQKAYDTVLAMLRFDPGRHSVYDLWRDTGVNSGWIYVVLARMERQGVVTSGWVDQPEGHPRRRWYQIAAGGES